MGLEGAIAARNLEAAGLGHGQIMPLRSTGFNARRRRGVEKPPRTSLRRLARTEQRGAEDPQLPPKTLVRNAGPGGFRHRQKLGQAGQREGDRGHPSRVEGGASPEQASAHRRQTSDRGTVPRVLVRSPQLCELVSDRVLRFVAQGPRPRIGHERRQDLRARVGLGFGREAEGDRLRTCEEGPERGRGIIATQPIPVLHGQLLETARKSGLQVEDALEAGDPVELLASIGQDAEGVGAAGPVREQQVQRSSNGLIQPHVEQTRELVCDPRIFVRRDLIQVGADHGFLVREVLVERAYAVARDLGDPVRRCGVVAIAAEHAVDGLQDRFDRPAGPCLDGLLAQM